MISDIINDHINDQGVASWVYVFVNVLIIGLLKSAACFCWNSNGEIELLFFPLIIATGIKTIVAFKYLVSGDNFYMDLGGITSKLAVLYFIVSVVSIVV
ncbi:MAG: hypothetical protein K6F39_00495 [Lachnospiraceae bacterium]|nr:hypothetical protein [Lachnospiraceae bacterium]